MKTRFKSWRVKTRGRPLSVLTLGLMVVAAIAAVTTFVIFKPEIDASLSSSDTVMAEFPNNPRDRLEPYKSTVKFAGIEVGRVGEMKQTDHGTTLVSLKINLDMGKLGPKPSAAIAPATLLDGAYSVELYSGGGPGSFNTDKPIPISRTRTPVELDSILENLNKPVRQSLQGTVGNLNNTLAGGGTDAVRQLTADGPATFQPAAGVLTAAQGDQPRDNLPKLVTSLESTATVVSHQSNQVGAIVNDLAATTGVLDQQRNALASTIGAMPPTLEHTRAGLHGLDGTLDELTSTATALRPTARQLDPLLQQLNPVLANARPVVSDLRPLLNDAQPAVQQLAPVARQADNILGDVQGPVLDRVNGPILNTVLNPYRGTGPYSGTGDGVQAGHKFYEELGYMVTNLDRASQVHDANGASLNFLVGAGGTTPTAGNKNLEWFLRHLATLPGAPTGPPGGPAKPMAPAPGPANSSGGGQ